MKTDEQEWASNNLSAALETHPFDATAPTERPLDATEERITGEFVQRLADLGIGAEEAISACLAAAVRCAAWYDSHPETGVTSRTVFNRVLVTVLEQSRDARIVAVCAVHAETIATALREGLVLVDLTTAPPTIVVVSIEDAAKRVNIPVPAAARIIFIGEDFECIDGGHLDATGGHAAGAPRR